MSSRPGCRSRRARPYLRRDLVTGLRLGLGQGVGRLGVESEARGRADVARQPQRGVGADLATVAQDVADPLSDREVCAA